MRRDGIIAPCQNAAQIDHESIDDGWFAERDHRDCEYRQMSHAYAVGSLFLLN